MPPKKKKAKGKGKGSAKKKSARASAGQTQKSSAPETLSELSREFYLVQIKDLETRLHRYQKKCDELELKNTDLATASSKLEEDRRDMSKLFTKQLEERATHVADLEERAMALDQQARAERQQYEAQIQSIRTMAQEAKDQLKSELTLVKGELDSLKEFRAKKHEIEKALEDLKEQLVNKETEHQAAVYQLERKGVEDKNRLKKEMEKRVNDVAAEFRKVSNRQMAETTKRTIRENVAISSQLGKMSDKTMELVQENDDMRRKERECRVKVGILEANEKELARKHLSSEKMVRMLVQKVAEQDAMLEEYMNRDARSQEVEAELAATSEEAEKAIQEAQELQRQLDEHEQKVDKLNSETAEVRRQNKQLMAILSQSAEAVRSALKMSSSESEIQQSDDDDEITRNSMLFALLELLNSAATSGIIPGPAHLSSDVDQKPKRKGIIKVQARPASGRVVSVPPHYYLGDLGIIPKPAKPLGQVKGVVRSRNVGVQTAAMGKPFVIRADQLKRDIVPRTLPSIGSSVNVSRRF